MNSNYHHTSWGTDYTNNSDGTVTRKRNSSETRGDVGLWIFLILSIISSIILGILLYNTTEELNYANNELSRKSSKVDDLKTQYNSLEKEYTNLKKFAETTPLFISHIEIENTDNVGNVISDGILYSDLAEYLKPKIHYVSNKEQTVVLKVSWYNSEGTLRCNSKSPSDCTYSSEYVLHEGNNNLSMVGWGNEYRTSWPAGKYSVEIWWKKICLGVKHFEVY